MKKALLILVTAIVVFVGGFYWHAWLKMENAPVGRVIAAAIAKDHTGKVGTWIPRFLLNRYLRKATYDVKRTVQGSRVPLFNFSLFAYSKRKPENNERVFRVAGILLERGANINARDSKTGRTALHEAIMFNQPVVIRFLIKHRADPTVRVNQPRSKFHHTNAPEFAKLIQKMDKNIDYSEVIRIVESYHTSYTKETKPGTAK